MVNQREGFKIERGIPCPKRRARYPWREMKIGDSFVVKEIKEPARHALWHLAKRVGIRITMAEEGKGWRVWRVE